MHLISHRLHVEENGKPVGAFVFLLESIARERLDHYVKQYQAMDWEVNPNSSPNTVKLVKLESAETACIHLHSTPFDDNKRFYAPGLTIYDNT